MPDELPLWRLLAYREADGATNMAVDEAVLEAHLQNIAPPTLRFYGFSPPAISLGLNQKVPEGLLERAGQAGFEVVRRPSGGRAVLHFADFTYSFVGSAATADYPGGFLSPSVSGAYKQICRGLQIGFAKLGLSLELGQSDAAYRKLHDCFGAISGSDLHYQGKKMIGSAQVRRRQGVLQHGSILLNQEQNLMPRLLQQGNPIAERHANLYSALNCNLALTQIAEALKTGFETAFGVRLHVGELSDFEVELLQRLKPGYLVESAAGLPASVAAGLSDSVF